MTWGYGIRREEIETDTVAIIHTVLFDYTSPGFTGVGMPIGRVFWADQSDAPAPERPYISVTMDNPLSQGPAGRPTSAEMRRYSVTEEWLITVVAVVGSPQRITIKGVDYDHVPVGSDVTDTRDALLVLLGSDPESTSVAVGADQIRITSNARGDRLLLTTSPSATLVARQTRAQILSRLTQAVYCLMKIRCFGFFSLTAPTADNSGLHLASMIELGLLHPDITQVMRSHCHIFRKVQAMPNLGGSFEQEVRSLGGLDILLNTEARLDATIPSTTGVAGTVNTYSNFSVVAPPP